MPNTERKCTIEECIALSSAAEEVSGFKCTNCKSIGRAQKKLDIWRLPRYLIIHLQRFYNNGYLKKRLAEVEFPLDNLQVPSKLKGGRLAEDGRSQTSYFQLYGVSNHYGSMDTGHYTAYCRRTCWAKYDDQDVTTISPQLVGTAAAYILFYKNREFG
jgi:ubiquitin C-terminal hydrolase